MAEGEVLLEASLGIGVRRKTELQSLTLLLEFHFILGTHDVKRWYTCMHGPEVLYASHVP